MTKTQPQISDRDEEAVAPSKLAEFFAFIKTARAFRGDLSAITAPAFILSPISLTEYPSYWCEDPAQFVAPTKHQSKDQRALAVLKWYLGTLRAQWVRRRGMKKKPLNPILGELFLGHWEDEECGRTEVVVEQVSHHPPITAYRICNDRHDVTMEGYHVQKTYFRGSPHIERVGQVMLRLGPFDEEYVLTLPTMHLEGLIPPPPYPELEGKSFIVGSNGTRAEIEYSGRGWWRGKKNFFRARLFEEEKREVPLFVVEGQWHGGPFKVMDSEGRQLEEVTNGVSDEPSALIVKPIKDQDPLESRRVWHKVATAIEAGELGTVNREKHQIEEDQRILRRKELAEGIEWKARYFAPGEWDQAEKLLARIGRGIERDQTKGIWRWMGDK